MKHVRTQASAVALLASVLLSAGCGVELAETDQARETQSAIGSSKPRVDISDWNGLAAMVSDGNYRLTADINANGKSWTPKDFSGTFDGNGRTISNLTINVSDNAGFFRTLDQALVKNVKFTNLKVTGVWMVGGLAGYAHESQVETVAIEGTMTATSGFAVGGIFGEMLGGSILRSYAKGTAQSALYFAGGLVGFMGSGSSSAAVVKQSYAQVTVTADTNDAQRSAIAGGIAGWMQGADIHDVYAVGNVTGRNSVGGLVGYLACDGSASWLLYKGIYRGDVVDKSAPAGGWAGTVGDREPCTGRFANLFWDRTLDPSSNWMNDAEAVLAQYRGTSTELRSPTTVKGGIYCMQDVVPGRCGDNNFETTIWTAGTNMEHHALLNMPGPNAQPR